MTDLAKSAVDQSLEVVRRRIDELGTREASIQRQGEDRILVQVPGEKDPENIKRLLGKTARLTFQMVDLDGSVAGCARRQGAARRRAAADRPRREQRRLALPRCKRQVELSGENLTDAQPTFQDNQPVVSFRFDSAGARKFGRITQENVGKLVRDRARRQGDLRPEHPRADPGRLRHHLAAASPSRAPTSCRSCCAPARCRRRSRWSRSAPSAPSWAPIRSAPAPSPAVVACVLVVGLMLVYYGIFGLIADVALVVNVVLILGIM